MYEKDHMEANMSNTVGEPFITFACLSFLTGSVCGWEVLELLQLRRLPRLGHTHS
jgi:hypothetical protein